jgi:hypothetical protein
VPEYKLSDIDKAKCFEHLQCGYNPAVSYRTLWHDLPPITYPQFLSQYGEFIVQVTRPTGDRWAVAPDAAQLANLRRIERCAEIAMQAVEEVLVAEEPEPVEGQRFAPDPFAKYHVLTKLMAVLVQLAEFTFKARKRALEDAAAIVGMLAVNAGAKKAD